MQLHEATQVIEVQGHAAANELLKEGWILLAVVPSAQACPWYVMGKQTVA
ncbi:hypothetical protein J2W83_001326 [Pseudomonas hunanensis]|uniref:Uncharacterized protein n=1 Tax=Pseudomonas hunanensis TaxID=1247546 RepID=A0ACC6JZV0_9PSED|nr:hypothetical protein [Pseudomonas hunanensis]